MRLSIESALAIRYPDYRMYTVVATGIDNQNSSEALTVALRSAEQAILKNPELSDLKTNPRIAAWEKAFREFGADPAITKPSLEALLHRVLSGHEIPSINKVVDISNLVSLKHLVPSGGDDLAKIDGDFGLRYSTGLEEFLPINSKDEEQPVPGEVIYADEQKVLCRCWIWRQSEHSKITESSRVVAVNVDVMPPATPEEGKAAAEEIAKLIETYCGGTTRIITIGAEALSVPLESEVSALIARARISDDSIRRTIKEHESILSDVDDMAQWSMHDLLHRGNVERIVVEDTLLARLSANERLSIYQGFDPTSPDMHVGHLVSLRVLRWFQLHNHRVIFLLGDATALIGDPSGRSEQREMLTHEKVQANMVTYQEQAGIVLEFNSAHNPVELMKNSDWLLSLTLADMIGLMSRITAQQLLQRDMFQARMKKNEPLYYVETLYPLLQGYDSVAMKVDAELGGRDQLFNMLVGRDLASSYLGKEKAVLTTPLLQGFDGRKMSKTYGNTVNLTASPFAIFDGIMRVKDELILKYARLLTNIRWTDLARLEEQLPNDPLAVKEEVAFDITRTLKGEKGAREAHAEFVKVRREGSLPQDMPVSLLPGLPGESLLVDVLASAKPPVVSSKSELRRLIKQGGVMLNGERVVDEKEKKDARSLHGQVLRIGKGRFTRLFVEM
jgi:tyrosyl-tRNA synthetase